MTEKESRFKRTSIFELDGIPEMEEAIPCVEKKRKAKPRKKKEKQIYSPTTRKSMINSNEYNNL